MVLRRRYRILIGLTAFAIVTTVFGLVFLFFTTGGSGVVATHGISQFADAEGTKFEHAEGDLASGLTLIGVEIKAPQGLPDGSVIRAEKLFIWLKSATPGGLEAEVFGGSCILPDNETVAFEVSYKDMALAATIKGARLSLSSIANFLGYKNITLSGAITDYHIDIKSALGTTAAKGSFFVDGASYGGFTVTQAGGEFSLTSQVGEVVPVISGNILFKDIEILSSADLPYTTRVPQLRFSYVISTEKGAVITINNGKLSLANSDPLIFYGNATQGNLAFNLFCKQLSLYDISGLMSRPTLLDTSSGILRDCDIVVKGSLFEPVTEGTLSVEKFFYRNFSVSECPISFTVAYLLINDKRVPDGLAKATGGNIQGPNKVTVKLTQGSVFFNKKQHALLFDVKGAADIEKVKIHITAAGTLDKPDLKLTSEPPISQDRLLFMLVTGKTWKNTETAFGNKQLSADVAADFIDYFVFAGSGRKAADFLGLSEISVRYNNGTRAVGVKKEFSDKIEGSYSIEQRTQSSTKPQTSQKVGGEYKIRDNVSVGVEKELRQDQKTQSDDKQKTDDTVFIKYKQNF